MESMFTYAKARLGRVGGSKQTAAITGPGIFDSTEASFGTKELLFEVLNKRVRKLDGVSSKGITGREADKIIDSLFIVIRRSWQKPFKYGVVLGKYTKQSGETGEIVLDKEIMEILAKEGGASAKGFLSIKRQAHIDKLSSFAKKVGFKSIEDLVNYIRRDGYLTLMSYLLDLEAGADENNDRTTMKVVRNFIDFHDNNLMEYFVECNGLLFPTLATMHKFGVRVSKAKYKEDFALYLKLGPFVLESPSFFKRHAVHVSKLWKSL